MDDDEKFLNEQISNWLRQRLADTEFALAQSFAENQLLRQMVSAATEPAADPDTEPADA